MPFADFIKANGITFSVSRDGQNIADVCGLKDRDKERRCDCIMFFPDADVKIGDVLQAPDGKAFHVTDIDTQYIHGKPEYMTAFQEAPARTAVFNIGSVNNSVVGTHNSVTMALQDMKVKADSEGGDDKAELREIIALLEKILNGQETPQKGLFAKFSSTLERHSWLSSSVASTLLSWLTSQFL
jgi:hypothetical protein